MIMERWSVLEKVLVCGVAIPVATMVSLALLQPVEGAEESGEVVVTLSSKIEMQWETDAAYCGDEHSPDKDICLDLSPSSPVGTGSGRVTVKCNSPNGYFVTLKMRNDDANMNRLVSADTASYLAPVASTSLTANSWGYYAGPTALYGAVPLASSAGANIINSASTTNRGAGPGEDEIAVTFGAMVDSTLPGETSYANQVVFTAAANAL